MKSKSYKNEIVWIIGASTGIGKALAETLAARGAILALSGRTQEKLEALKLSLGVQHKVFVLDVSNTALVLRTAQAIQSAFGRLDRILILSAAYSPMALQKLDILATKQIMDVNILGTLNVIHATLPILSLQKQPSQIAIFGSVAGYVGLPVGQPYSMTKSALINLAESLYCEAPQNVDIKLICPGFVKTRLTDKNQFKMPMMLSPEAAANEIAKGLLSKKFEIHFPKGFTLFLKWLRMLPYPIFFYLMKKIPMPQQTESNSGLGS